MENCIIEYLLWRSVMSILSKEVYLGHNSGDSKSKIRWSQLVSPWWGLNGNLHGKGWSPCGRKSSHLFFFQYWGLNSGPTPSAPRQPFCYVFFFFFQDRVSRTVCPGWLQTSILLISAFWVVRIIGVSYQHPAKSSRLEIVSQRPV
jgi:hypothetical protein